MLSAFLGAFQDVLKPVFRRLMLLSALLTFLCWGVILWLCWKGLSFLELSQTQWITDTIHVLGFLTAFIASLFFLPALAGMMISFFTETFLKRLSKQKNGRVFKEIPFKTSLKISGKSAVKSMMNAGVFMPLCLLTGFIPVINLIPVGLYYMANGRVLGFEYFMSTAIGFLSEEKAYDLYRKNKKFLNRAGILIAFLMTLPIMNIMAPAVATAFMYRLFVMLEQKKK